MASSNVAAAAARTYYDNPGAGAFFATFTQNYASSDNVLNDINQLGYLAPNVRVVAVGFFPTDMDTNGTPTVVHKITVGAVDIVTGLTGAQTGTSAWLPVLSTVAPVDQGAGPEVPTLVQLQTTTAAATAAAGSIVVVLLCQKF